jgi:arylsulfatase B
MHWPKGGVDHGVDVNDLAAHIDVLPTLGELCGLKPIRQDQQPRGPLDGRSLAELIRHGGQGDRSPAPRTLFVHSQRTQHPIKWRKSAVMTEQYRLVNGEELYDIVKDPGQQNDIAQDHPDVVKRLRGEYDQWWDSLKPVFDDVVRFDLGGAQNPTTLMSHDWFMEGTTPSAWHHAYVQRNELRNGPFMVNIVEPGRYRITPRRWPAYVDKPSGCVKARVVVQVAGGRAVERDALVIHNTIQADPDKAVPALTLDLPAGPASLSATLTRADGETYGAYYVQVERVGPTKP